MQLTVNHFISFFTFASMVASSAVYSQTDNTAPTITPLSEIEDATLDGSGRDAASAVNAVEDPAKKAEAAPASTVPEIPLQQKPSEAAAELEKIEAEPVDAEPAVPHTPTADPIVEEKSASKDKSDQDTHAIETSKVKGTYGGRVFGRYKVQLSGNRPTFNEGQKCYEKLYGKPETYFSMSGDWFPLDLWINPGIMTRIGTYSVRGKASRGSNQNSKSIDCESLTVDTNSRTTMLFVPIQLGVKIQVTPFRRKWVVLDVWSAGEYGWFQETRDNTTAMVTPFSLLAVDRVYTNTGRKRAISNGASVHLLLNSLDEKTVRSMVDTMGLGYVYLTGFMENVASQTKDGLTFGRKVLGIGFTFETYK